MARYRRSYRRQRRPQNLVWQTYHNAKLLALSTTVDNESIDDQLFDTDLIPGTGDVRDRTTATDFQNDHTLERIRGQVIHRATGYTGNKAQSFPFIMAAIRVPKGLTISTDETDVPNLFDSTNIGNLELVWVHHGICDSAGGAQPTIHMVDSKAKRKFEIGDRVKWFYSLVAPFTDPTWNIHVAVNLRFLWKLKN